MVRFVRIVLLSVLGFVAVTALAGGIALIVGSIDPQLGSVLVPPVEYLEGSPFASFIVPGAALIVLVSGTHALAFFAVLRHAGRAAFLASAAGFACLIWIFIQMVFIPFSPLQAVYFLAGMLELGLVLVQLGVLDFEPYPRRSTALPRRHEANSPAEP